MPITFKLSRKFSLAGIADEWDDDCYIRYNTITVAERRELAAEAIEKRMTDEDATKRIAEVVAAHITGGQVYSQAEGGGLTLVKFDASDATDVLDLLPMGIIERIYDAMNSSEYSHPKA
ncbi:hypothetical protein [Rhodococcus sp. HS-D2]|uniref:hypothetical protein n=1 Tax=Rhodococcus sp. HS-D2 TaxID=1384636 RepID=UPI0007D9F9C9|nr:hypothetical protein [Rhodococcus sp. HS-D2]